MRIRTLIGAAAAVGTIAIVPAGPASATSDYALEFDGSHDYAGAGVEVITTSAGQAFTVEARLLDPVEDDGTWRHAVSQGQGGSAFYIGTANGSQELRAGDTWLATGVDLPVGRWVHVAVTTPGDGTAKLYLDGVLEATLGAGFSAPVGIGTDFQLGRQYTGTEFWNGGIDLVRVWDVERTQAQLAAAMATPVASGSAGLVAQYRLDEGTGRVAANDVTGASRLTDLNLGALGPFDGPEWVLVAVRAVDDPAPTPVAMTVTCAPTPPRVGVEVRCEAAAGDPDVDVLWRVVAGGEVVASGPVRLGATGAGSFAFTPSAAVLGRAITVELVEWTTPRELGVATGPVPAAVPAGEGTTPSPPWVGLLLLVGVPLLVAVGARARIGRSRHFDVGSRRAVT